MRKIYLTLLASLALTCTKAQNVTYEGFETLDAQIIAGTWVQVNNSSPIGAEIWHNGFGLAINAYDGTAGSFAEAGFQSIAATSSGYISNWLITPTINLANGMIVSFYTTSYNNLNFPDRLELRFNQLNTVNVGATTTSVGDFTDSLLTINPGLVMDSTLYPQNYWGQFGATISGLSAPTDCRIAFRYHVTDGGETGANSSTIGIDAFSVDIATSIAKPEAGNFNLNVFPNPTNERLTLDFLTPLKEKATVDIYNTLGVKVISFIAQPGQLKASFSVENLSSGSYIVSVNSNEGITKKTFVKN